MMRAKLRLDRVLIGEDKSESLLFSAVAANKYPDSGDDENNTYAKFTPIATLSMMVSNPALQGKFKAGQEFYVDFKPVDGEAVEVEASTDGSPDSEPPEDDGDDELNLDEGTEE